MSLRLLTAALVFVVACSSGEDGPPSVDAAPSSIDAAVTLIDAPAQLPLCTNALYEPCTDNAQCASGICRQFNGLGAMVCTEMCTPGGTPCPVSPGNDITCSNASVCRPERPINCRR